MSRLAPMGVPKIAECMDNNVPTFFKFKLKLKEIKEIINLVKIKSSPRPDLNNHYILKLIPDSG